nr:7015_t:CDS:2 [Entrophospora candida]
MVSYRPNDSSDGELLRTIQGSNPAGIYYNELAPILPLPIDLPQCSSSIPVEQSSNSTATIERKSISDNNHLPSPQINADTTPQPQLVTNVETSSSPLSLSSVPAPILEVPILQDQGKVEDGEKSQKDYDPEFARILEMKLQELQKLKKHSLNANDSVTYSDATTTKNYENVNVVDNNCGSGSKDDDDERELPNKLFANNRNRRNGNQKDDDVEDEEGEQRIYKKMRPINTLRLKKSILQNKNNSNKNNNNNNNKRWIRRRIIN